MAKLWGYQNFHAISKGVVTPTNTNYIIFFVTKDKQEALTQYNDYIDGNMLFWEHELKEPKKVVAKIVRMDVNVHAIQTKPTKVG